MNDTIRDKAEQTARIRKAEKRVVDAAKSWAKAQEDDRASHEALRDAVLALREVEKAKP